MFRTALEPIQPPIQFVPGYFSGKKEWSGLEVDISHPSSADSGAKQSLLLYVFRTVTGTHLTSLFTSHESQSHFLIQPI